MPEPSNPRNDDTGDVERRTRHILNRIGFVLGLILMAVGLTGELLGWFDAVGLVLSFTGMAASVLTLLTDESDALRMAHHQTHANQESMLENQQGMLENQQGMLENQQGMLENQEEMVAHLERIGDLLEERLPSDGF